MSDGVRPPAASVPAGGASGTRLVLVFSATTLIWGSTFLAISIGNDTLPPVWAAALRLALAALVLAVIARILRQPLPRGRALAHAVGFGVFQFGFGFPLIYWGETRVASGLTAVLFATVPLTSALFARAMGIEPLSRQRVIGALISMSGIAIIFSGELVGHTPLLPLLSVVAATLSAVTGTMLFKKGPRQNVIPANVAACTVAAVISGLISLVAREPHPLPHTARALLPILYLVLAGSVGAFVMWTWLVSRWSVTRLSFMAVLTPLIALALGALVRHERLAPLTLAGGLVVLAGVAIGMRPARAAA
jgi:drug/metabolite transporter (DMT)-like permease